MSERRREFWPADPDAWTEAYLGWLSQDPEGDSGQFASWMAGHDLPAGDPEADQYLALLEPLPLGADRIKATRTLATLAKGALENAMGRESDRFFFNLLHLCSSLGRPSILADPLDRFLDRVTLKGRTYGGYRIDVSSALRFALMWNQADLRWAKKVWLEMVRGRCDRVAGMWKDGVDGILAMPVGLTAQLEVLESPRDATGAIPAGYETRLYEALEYAGRALRSAGDDPRTGVAGMGLPPDSIANPEPESASPRSSPRPPRTPPSPEPGRAASLPPSSPR